MISDGLLTTLHYVSLVAACAIIILLAWRTFRPSKGE
jgi:hypothetical protein